MLTHRASVIGTMILFCGLLLASCATVPAPMVNRTPTVSQVTPTAARVLPSPTTIPGTPSGPAPKNYTTRTLLKGVGRPDDLAFDQQGNLLFSDFYNGTISKVNGDGTATILLRGLAGPEGMAVLPDGTLIIAEQTTHRILALAPGATTPTIVRQVPGTPSKVRCKDGVDGVAYDATTNTIIVPDSPTGEVYRMSIDGKTLTLLASGIVRPVGAMVDKQGNIYVADECGGAVVRITAPGKTTRFGGFGMPDDVALDARGNLLIIDLAPSIHALIRLNMQTGQQETLARQGFIEPQGLVIDSHDNIFVADDYANVIMEFSPAA